MNSSRPIPISPVLFLLIISSIFAQEKQNYVLYPDVNPFRPNLPSPYKDQNNKEYVVAVTKEDKYAVMDVTMSNERKICLQLEINYQDFPTLANTGLHSETELRDLAEITGRSFDEINRLARPNGLSQDGFLAEDENILSVLIGDNRRVKALGLTHPYLAKPLFHVLNMMDDDLKLNRWNMARHRWDNIQYFYYNDIQVFVDVGDTKGGQKSIFDDGIQGGFHIRLWRDPDAEDLDLLKKNYSHLTEQQLEQLINLLTVINTGEIEPQYIMRYGFYEGHTFWRADPLAIAYIFGLKTLYQIEATFPGELYEVMTSHFVN